MTAPSDRGTLRRLVCVLLPGPRKRQPEPESEMARAIFTPSTNPTAPQAPDRLLVFIQQAQLALVYSSPR